MVVGVDYIGVSLARWQGEEAYNERRMLKRSKLLKITEQLSVCKSLINVSTRYFYNEALLFFSCIFG
jgi:hypothetical protein